MDKAVKRIYEVIDFCMKGDYLFRGEGQDFGKVSSSLYRHFEPRDNKNKKIVQRSLDDIQKKLIDSAKKHIGDNRTDREVLTELRHYGTNINVIDFTNNVLIALFFACDELPDDQGRILCLNKKATNVGESVGPYSSTNKNTGKIVFFDAAGKHSRGIFQSSVFVHSSKGYIDIDKEYIDIDKRTMQQILVEKCLKKDILKILEGTFNIHRGSIYNDIHGFIQHEAPRIIESLETTESMLANEKQKGKTLKRIPTKNRKKED